MPEERIDLIAERWKIRSFHVREWRWKIIPVSRWKTEIIDAMGIPHLIGNSASKLDALQIHQDVALLAQRAPSPLILLEIPNGDVLQLHQKPPDSEGTPTGADAGPASSTK